MKYKVDTIASFRKEAKKLIKKYPSLKNELVDLGSQLVPYVGGSVGLLWVDTERDSDTAIEASGYGGARYFFVDYAAIGAALVLNVATEDMYNGGEDAIDWTAVLNTSWYF